MDKPNTHVPILSFSEPLCHENDQHEVERFHCVLVKALAGEVGMSKESDDIARCLYNGLIPNFVILFRR